MSANPCFFTLAAAGATAFALVAAIFVPFGALLAADQSFDTTTPPNPSALKTTAKLPEVKPDIKVAKVILDENDEYAALESVQFALTEVADGSSYIWHRGHGKLSGLVKPVSSFKDMRGSVCRHAVVVLSGVEVTNRTEIVACRLPTGIWQVES